MDSKISAFPVASTLSAAALIPMVVGGVNQVITIGVLSQNLPNVGNKGITKNVVTASDTTNIPLTTTLVVIPASVTPYVLPNGVGGQELKIVSTGASTVNITSSLVSTISMVSDSSVTLVFIATRWVPLSYHNCTLT